MKREQKAETIDSLQAHISECNIGILTDYRGLSVSEISDLRRKLKEANIDYTVVKNTLARFAAERSGMEELTTLFKGPVAVAFGYGEAVEPAKILAEYIRSGVNENFSIKGGFLKDKILTADEVKTLSTLPSREVLIAKVVGGMQSPIYGLVNCLAGPLRGFMGILQARIQQLEGE